MQWHVVITCTARTIGSTCTNTFVKSNFKFFYSHKSRTRGLYALAIDDATQPVKSCLTV